MTNCVDTQIKTAYELHGMSPEEISEDQGLDLVAVKSKLMQVSSVFRKNCGLSSPDVDDGLNFTEDDLRRVNEVILTLALSAEDEHLRGKMATYVRDDKKGRKEVAKLMKGTTFNILSFNEMIHQARIGALDVKKQLMAPALDVE
jgi:hypothetical protein